MSTTSWTPRLWTLFFPLYSLIFQKWWSVCVHMHMPGHRKGEMYNLIQHRSCQKLESNRWDVKVVVLQRSGEQKDKFLVVGRNLGIRGKLENCDVDYNWGSSWAWCGGRKGSNKEKVLTAYKFENVISNSDVCDICVTSAGCLSAMSYSVIFWFLWIYTKTI